jgi:Cft2 family RNA processing exonuclease
LRLGYAVTWAGKNLPLLNDPVIPKKPGLPDHESTYGGRLHRPIEEKRSPKLRQAVNKASAQGRQGAYSFFYFRTHAGDHFTFWGELLKEKLIPEMPI